MNNDIALLGDTHWDISDLLLDSQIDFIIKQFVPYLHKKKIDTIKQFGDIFDNRRHISIKTMNRILSLFENELAPFQFHCILGNHDVNLRNSNEIHSLKLLSRFPNVHIYENITKVKIKNRNFLMVPWLYDLDHFKNYIAENIVDDVDVVCGHFDILNGQMGKNSFSKSGLQKELLFQFPKVFSGHYHTISSIKNGDKEIKYIGSPYQLNFGDSGEPRGFHILNCDDLSYEFVENTTSIKFVNINYPDPITEEMVKGNKVNVYLKDGNEDSDSIQEYLEEINKFKPISNPVLKTIENFDGKNEINNSELQVKSLKELFSIYLNGLNLGEEVKSDVEEMIYSLYEECQRE